MSHSGHHQGRDHRPHQPRPTPRRPALRTPRAHQPSHPRHDPQAYLEALLRFWADARDTLDDATFTEALPLLEQLQRIPEPRDPDHPGNPR